jgi:hypothetical protein
MAFQPCPNVLKHEVYFTCSGVKGVSVLHTNFATPASLTDVQNAATALRGAYVASVLPHKTTGFTLNEVVTTDLSVEGGVQGVALGTDPAPSGSEIAPPFMGMVVQLLTDIRGRSYRGRVFDNGYYSGRFNPDGTVVASEKGVVAGNWQAMNDALATAVSGPLVVLSRFHARAARPTGIWTPVVRFAVSNDAGIQRRRRVPA